MYAIRSYYESAVYRISGVFSVIGGWFLTALIAFTVSAIIALLISLSGSFMIFVFIAVAILMVIRTHVLFKKVVDWVKAVDGVSFTVRKGETLGLVRNNFV